MAVRQARWSVLLHAAGTVASGATLCAVPPRNCGHSSADAVPKPSRHNVRADRNVNCMIIPFIEL